MAICGFNDKIGEGLHLLVEGMIEALEKKAAATSAHVVLANELVELDNIISVLRNAKEEVLPEMFIGLNLLAKALFTEVQHDLHASRDKNLGKACREVGDRFIDLLAQTERKHEEMHLQESDGDLVARRARKLAEWALEYSRSAASVCLPNG